MQDGERAVTLRRVGERADRSARCYHMPRGAHPDCRRHRRARRRARRSRPSGRLYKALVETKKATSVEALDVVDCTTRASSFLARRCRTASRSTPARDAHARDGRGHRKRSRSPRPKSSACARRRCQGLRRDAQRSAAARRRAVASAIALGDWRLFFLQRDRWRTVTPADVQRVATQYLKPSNLTVGDVPARRQARPRADAARASTCRRCVNDYKGDPGRRRRRVVRSVAGEPRGAHAAVRSFRTA